MYIGKKIEQFKHGTMIVPFCKDCDSQDIETIQTCKCCGSHNIESSWDDSRSEKETFIEKEISIYKCDNCKKEFNGLEIINVIYYYNGEFSETKCSYIDNISYPLNKDLCEDCKRSLVKQLNNFLNEFTNTQNINNLITNFLNKGDNK